MALFLFLADRFLHLMGLLLIIPVLTTWFPDLRKWVIVDWVCALFDPIFQAIRAIIPPISGVLDLSPLVVWLALQALRRAIALVARG